MLIKISKFEDIDSKKLMDIYSESNFENTDYFFPDEKDKSKAVKQVEDGFLNFLKIEFFKKDDAIYWVLEENGDWKCALRTCKVEENIYYLEALETAPCQRKRGYGSKLLSLVVEEFKKMGSFKLCDCVSKNNRASLAVHQKCGFQIVGDNGYDYLRKETNEYDYALEYRCI
ncbi:MAG: GNAT family N-acetyltransferase [Bacilli bacterium]|nr:GNAT family N-acetyltransferase [Bacilli bacterium]